MVHISSSFKTSIRPIFSILIFCSTFLFAMVTIVKSEAVQQSKNPESLGLSNLTIADESKRKSRRIPIALYPPAIDLLELMDEPNVEQEMEKSLAILAKDQKVLPYLTKLYEQLSDKSIEKDEDSGANTGYTRWKVVYLMGRLGNSKTTQQLSKIALSSLPDPEVVGEVSFAAEYRIRLRAIDGLERLKAREPLRRLYKQGGELSQAAAVSLFELGERVEGIKKIDGKRAFGLGDPKNYNIKRKDKLAAQEFEKNASPSAIQDFGGKQSLPAMEQEQNLVVPFGKSDTEQLKR